MIGKGNRNMKILIKNGRVLNPATNFDQVADVLIEEDKIVRIARYIDENADEVIDARGKFVMPGFIDLHVHFRDPGFTHKEDIITGAKAAAAGGVTTVCAMPNTKPAVDNMETLNYILDKAKNATTNVCQLSAITKDMAGETLVDFKTMKEAGAIAFSEDGKSVMDINLYYEALKQIKDMDALVMAHCEEKNLVKDGAMNEGPVSQSLGIPGILNAVEDIITARDIFLANETGVRLHICHVSTEGAVRLIKMAKEMGINVTGEACPHHFILSDSVIDKDDANFKMNPPLRSEKDVKAIIEGLKTGVLDAISTDHAPHHKDEKSKGIKEAPFGIVGLETSAALTYTALVERGILTPLQMAEKMSYNPAKILKIDDKRGRIEEGMIADIVIFDPSEEVVIDAGKFRSKASNTPFDGKLVKGRVNCTILSGTIVFDSCKFI